MKNKYVSIIAIVTLLMISSVAIQGQSANPNLVGNPEVDFPLTAFTPYSSSYKTKDALIVGKSVDLTILKGFELLKTNTQLDLMLSTFESDDVLLKGTTTLYDRNEYSKTFLNSTYEVGAVTSANITLTTNLAASMSDTKAVANATAGASSGTGETAIWTKTMGFDGNGDGDYVDTGDLGYMPIPNADIDFYVGFSADHSASITATSYGSIELSFQRASGTDYVVRIRAYQEAGNSGWSAISTSSASNDIIFSAYDADAQFIGLTFNLANLLSDDSADNTADINGLNLIRTKMAFEGADDSIEMIERNIAIFSSRPALTDNVDTAYKWNGVGNVAESMFVDSDILGTKITESGTEVYDYTIPMNLDQVDSMVLLKNARYLTFIGTARLAYDASNSAQYSISSAAVVGQSYYLTTLNLDIDTRDVSALDTFANVLSIGNLQFNFTVDDSQLPFKTDWDDNLVEFWIDSVDRTTAYKSAWRSTTVKDESEVQYDISDFDTTTGQLQKIVLKVYTSNAYSTTGGSTGGGAGQASSGLSNQTIGLIAGALLVGFALYFYTKLPKKNKNISGFFDESTSNTVWLFAFLGLAFVFFWFFIKPMFF